MQYALLIYGSGDGWEQLSTEEQQAQTQEYMALSQRPETQGGADLGDLSSATTVRVDNGDAVTTDGPFAETKEQIGGLFVTTLPDLDEAIRIAALVPAAETGSLEIRPIVER